MNESPPDRREALKEPENFTPGAYPGVLHHYSAKLTAFEHQPSHRNTTSYKPHALIFIGGLGDGLLTVPFVPPLALALAPTAWSVFSILLSSSYSGWGIHNLSDDCDEIAKAIAYVRKHKESTRPTDRTDRDDGKIVLFGHSTGSQDVLHYIVYDMRASPPVDGAILQAPVSDREGMTMELDNANDSTRKLYKDAMEHASHACEINEQDKAPLMPIEMTRPFYGDTPITADRWLSLQRRHYEYHVFVDDLFSSDVHGKQLSATFGGICKRVHLCVLYSGSDEHVPEWVDKEDLVGIWMRAVEKSSKAVWDKDHSGIVRGARHALDGKEQEEQRKELVNRVMGFLQKVEMDGTGKGASKPSRSRTFSRSGGNELDINFD